MFPQAQCPLPLRPTSRRTLDAELYEKMRDRGNLETTDAAREAAKATMRTLGERITPGEAEAIAVGLPDELGGTIAGLGGDAEAFGPEEFVDWVADREDEADQKVALRHARAILVTVGTRANRLEWRDVREQHPEEYAAFYEVREET